MSRKVEVIISIIIILALIGAFFSPDKIFLGTGVSNTVGEKGILTVHFIDTGLGDSILI